MDTPEFPDRAERRALCVAVVGLGAVGLPLAHALWSAGYRVLGWDADPARRGALREGRNPLAYWKDGALETMLADARFEALDSPAGLGSADALCLCVPTPLDAEDRPDLGCVRAAAELAADHARSGALVVLESTTWPGTTREVVAPILAAAAKDLALAYSPEREDPGRASRTASKLVKLVGGLDEDAAARAAALYAPCVPEVLVVSSPEVAEAAKLLENTFRAVNIALVNETKIVLQRLGVDVWEVIDAAATKPFGFMKFTPGPGMGGHCIPVDPFYLAWIARRAGASSRFVELAGEVNRRMPEYVVARLEEALALRDAALDGAEVLVLGLAYKPGVDATTQSPALRIAELLDRRGAAVDYHDPWIPQAPADTPALRSRDSVALDRGTVARYDAVVVATDHAETDWDAVAAGARLVVDARGALGSRMRGDPRWVPA